MKINLSQKINLGNVFEKGEISGHPRYVLCVLLTDLSLFALLLSFTLSLLKTPIKILISFKDSPSQPKGPLPI